MDSGKRKTFYEGEIHKCPNCGYILDSFVTICPSCKYELRGTKATSVVNELFKKLEQTESINQKIDLISNFYIPNNKEDICEFIILATSNIQAGGYGVEAWYAKLEQAYQKARLSFGNSPEFQYISELYYKSKKQQGAKTFSRKLLKSKLLQGLLIGTIGVILIIIGAIAVSLSGDPDDSPLYMIVVTGMGLGGFGFWLSTNNKSDK